MKTEKSELKFLPCTAEEMKELGWDYIDFVLVTGDAYVDHPSFGMAVIGRTLEAAGYRVAILAQPDWKTAEAFKVFGQPRLAFLVTSGNLDSMVAHYSVSRHARSRDDYSPAGKPGKRPDRAAIVYSNRIREAYGSIPLVLGGIEASLRRFAHYDYWDDKVRKSILADSGADLLVYGMGEKPIIQIAERLAAGAPVKTITDIRGTAYMTRDITTLQEQIIIPPYREVARDKRIYAEAFLLQLQEQDPITGTLLLQEHPNGWVVQNPPQLPLAADELDHVFDLPYARVPHPKYASQGVPAIEEVQNSIISARGCFGCCSFCAITFHQGRIVQGRSHKSILAEANKIINSPSFKGYINDVGGPTANFRFPACDKQLKTGSCKNRQCLFPKPCPKLKVSHKEYVELLRKLRNLPGVKKVFIRSGVRYDYALADPNPEFLQELCTHHVSGQLKVAPEHVDPGVLALMGKPSHEVFEQFRRRFEQLNKKAGKEQYLVPYLMSSHPGSTLAAAIRLAEFLKKIGYHPEQVQDFYPTPGTLSTTMYWTELDPRTMQSVYVPKKKAEKAMQRALLQYRYPQNRNLVIQALKLTGREDLIGNESHCLIRPGSNNYGSKTSKPQNSKNTAGRPDPRNKGSQNTNDRQYSKPNKSTNKVNKTSNGNRKKGR